MNPTAPLPPEGKGHPAPGRMAASRAAMATPTPALEGVVCTIQQFGGVGAVVCEPADAAGTIVYFHGGGFRLGEAVRWTSHGCRLALASGARVVIVDYRLAPEHPFPAGINDALSAYRAIADRWAGPIAIAGDSSGGNLALATTLVACEEGRAPHGLALLCPWLDLGAAGDSYDANAQTDALFSRTAALEASEHYLQGLAIDAHPLTHLLEADLTKLPPVQLFVSADEVVLSDSLTLSSRLALAHVAVEAHVLADLPHVWATLFPDRVESSRTVKRMAEFLRDQMERDRP